MLLTMLALSLFGFSQTSSEDFILLKTGELITGGFAKERFFKGTSLRMGDLTFKMREIKGFKRKGVYYENLSNKDYGIRLKAGAINLYQPVTSTKMTTASLKNNKIYYEIDKKNLYKFFIQKGDNSEAVKLKPSVLLDMVGTSKKAKKFALTYEHNEKKAKKVTAISVGLLGVGLVSLGGAAATSNSVLAATGGVSILGGLVGGLLVNPIKHKNPDNMKKAIDAFNKENQSDNKVEVNKVTTVKAEDKKRETMISDGLQDYDQKLSKRTNWNISVGGQGSYAFAKKYEYIEKNSTDLLIDKVSGFGAALYIYPKYTFVNTKKMSLSLGVPFAILYSIDVPLMFDINIGNEAKKVLDKKMGFYTGIGLGWQRTKGILIDTRYKSTGQIGPLVEDEKYAPINTVGPTAHVGVSFPVKTNIFGAERSIINGYRIAFKKSLNNSNDFISISTFYKF